MSNDMITPGSAWDFILKASSSMGDQMGFVAGGVIATATHYLRHDRADLALQMLEFFERYSEEQATPTDIAFAEELKKRAENGEFGELRESERGDDGN
jgi:hypothetical protein